MNRIYLYKWIIMNYLETGVEIGSDLESKAELTTKEKKEKKETANQRLTRERIGSHLEL